MYDRDSRTTVVVDSVRAQELQDNPKALLIVDGVPPPSMCRCAVVLITSPKRDVWWTFSKEPGCSQRFLPPPTLAEMQLMREHCFPNITEEGMMEGIRLFGLNPRAVFLKFAKKEWSESSLHSLIMTQSAELLMTAESLDSSGKDNPSHRLIFIRATDDFRDGGREFASVFVAELVCEKLTKDHYDQTQAWLKHAGDSPALAGMYGIVFERISIESIALGGPFMVKDLVTGKSVEESFERRDVSSCHELPKELDDGILFCAPHAKFPAIDAISRAVDGTLCTFNATVDPKHSVLMLDSTQTHGLAVLAEKYKRCNSRRHYLLLPEHKFSQLKTITPAQFDWRKPHKAKVDRGWVPKTFTADAMRAKQALWGISAVSIPLGQRLYSTLRPMIGRCLP